MKDDVIFIAPQTTVAQATILMRDEGIGFLPICDEARNVIGAITDRDVAVRVVASHQSIDEPVGSFMTQGIVTCRSDDDLTAAQDLMGEMQVSRIVCVGEDGQLEGVISLSDIAHAGDGVDATATLRSVTVRETRIV